MIRQLWIYVQIGLLLGVMGCKEGNLANDQENPETKLEYTWQQSYLGGGGYIVGILQNPKDPDQLFARCDVAGMFKSSDRGKSWKQINRGMSQCHHHSVESFAISPHNPSVLFRCSGEARGNHMFGDIHKSTNGGETWYPVLDQLDYAGNGANRMLGEMIGVDPFNPGRVVAGGFSKGIYYSEDQGESWKFGGLDKEPLGFVAFHPYVRNKLYVGTLSKLRYQEYLYPNGGYDREAVGRLYESNDGGKTFELIYESDQIEFGDIAFDPKRQDVLLVSGLESGVHRSTDGGHTFSRVMQGLPKNIRYNTISSDPNTPGTYYTAPSRRSKHVHVPLVPMYVSKDYGSSWNILNSYGEEDFKDYPSYIKDRKFLGWAISKVEPDLFDPQRLYMTNWYGVSVSEDGGLTWSGNNFEGTETICAEAIIGDPHDPGTFIFAMADHQPSITQDNGETYQQFIKRIPGEEYLPSSTALVSSKFKKGLVLYGNTERGTIRSGIRKSTDYGKTATMVTEFPQGLFVQSLREDPQEPGVFYAYVDGNLADGAGIYKSPDWGDTWKFIPIDLPDYIHQLPHQKEWIESEMLSIVFSQQKNVCGTNQLMDIDPFTSNTLYVGEWTEGLFKTDDDGVTWQDISKGLPFKNDKGTVLNTVVLDKNKEGHLYAGFIREGLWHSSDRGETWEKVYPEDDSIFNASSVIVGGTHPDEIYVASEPLYWSQSPSRIMYSPDRGASWQAIYDGELGALRWKGIAINPKSGRIQGVTAGNGAFYGDRTLP